MSAEGLRLASGEIIEAIDRWLEAFHTPLLVAIDGRAGTGKSTIAELVATSFGAAILHSDMFFAAQVTNAEWDAMSGAERARDCIDWVRLRRDAVLPLLDGNMAEFQGFDFAARRTDGSFPFSETSSRIGSRPIILMEGAYAARPELADLVGLSVLVEAPEAVRRERLTARESETFLLEWHRRWDPAERHYFGKVRPPASFDLVVQNN